jgi:hypothetical protein
MEIDTAALIRYDLCHESKSDLLLSSLRKLYDDEGKQFGESVLGGEQWERYRFEGKLPISGDGFDRFQSVKTFVSFETRHLIDTVTIAELSAGQVKEIEEEDPSRTQYVIDSLAERLTEVAQRIPTVAPTDFNRQPVQFYVEPLESQPVKEDDGEVSGELLIQFLEESREELSKIHYGVDHPQSLLNGEDLVTAQGTAFPWGKLTIFNLTSPPNSEAGFEPIWLRRIRPLHEYLRTYLWFSHRVSLLAELDRETHGIEELMRNSSSKSNQFQEVLEIENELDDIRETWTNRYTKTVDEVADLESRPPLRRSRRQQLEPVKIEEISQGAPVSSLLDIYDQQLATLSEQTSSDLDRIGSKLDQVSDYIQDKINVRATTATLRQQRATNYLTIVILVLTAVTVAIAAAELFWVG